MHCPFYAHNMTNIQRGRARKRFRLRITLTVSITLMLLVLGMVALTLVAGRNISRDIHERAGFVAVLSENATPKQADSLRRAIASHPYTAAVQYVTAEQVLDRWKHMAGEDFDMPDINPFLPEIEVAVREQWACADSLARIAGIIGSSPLVSKVSLHTEIVDSVNSAMHTVTVALIIIGAVLLLISLALINNTVRLTVYSQRFVINTMKLVGATAAFIRKPFVLDSLIHGAISGMLAVIMLGSALFYIQSAYPSSEAALPPWQTACVLCGVFLTGIMICTAAALMATNKYLHLGYDDMFR